jgi:hypothetical protein
VLDRLIDELRKCGRAARLIAVTSSPFKGPAMFGRVFSFASDNRHAHPGQDGIQCTVQQVGGPGVCPCFKL